MKSLKYPKLIVNFISQKTKEHKPAEWLKFCFFKGYSFPPKRVILELTYRCNLKCRMCTQYGNHTSDTSYKDMSAQKQELDIKEYKRIIDEAISMNINSCYITGGEPFLYKKILELISYIKQKGMYLSINPNGFFLEEYAHDLVTNNVNEIIVSVDGPAEIHNAIRKDEKSFEKAVKGLKAVSKYKSGIYPKIIVNCVLQETNFQYIEKLIPIAIEAKATTLNFQHLMFLNKESAKKHQKVYLEKIGEQATEIPIMASIRANIEVSKLLEVICAIETKNYPMQIGFSPYLTHDQIKEYYEDKTYNYTKDLFCSGPWKEIRIDPFGNVSPCNGYVAGNVKNKPITKIWNEKRMRCFRIALESAGGKFPGCVRCCVLFRSAS